MALQYKSAAFALSGGNPLVRNLGVLAALLVVILWALSAVFFRHPVNPEIHPQSAIQANMSVPPRVDAMLHRACYDCHSDETVWPWYSTVPPASWMISRDVTKGRRALNFSKWSEGNGRTPQLADASLAAACDGLKAGSMPKRTYRMMHASARLSASEIRDFCQWTIEQSNALKEGSGGDSHSGLIDHLASRSLR